MTYQYGEFASSQIADFKKYLQNKIFYLLLIVDPNTKNNYSNVSVPDAFDEILKLLAGYNNLLNYPKEVVDLSCKLSAALDVYGNGINVDFKTYRRLILGAGKEVETIKEV